MPRDAFGQFKDTEDWRKENSIDQLYETIDVDEYDESRKLVRILHYSPGDAAEHLRQNRH